MIRCSDYKQRTNVEESTLSLFLGRDIADYHPEITDAYLQTYLE